jgi:hypothetical protein
MFYGYSHVVDGVLYRSIYFGSVVVVDIAGVSIASTLTQHRLSWLSRRLCLVLTEY